ncbi:hypothetical protein GCM10025772_01910 [Ferrimonas gelatinilytica]|uniref:O-antigen ligase n=2 Tax=Ferrimonas gelatinilytica TaxID=1255257 RepID=A0ABP9RUF1_9GAMM
MVVFVIGNQEVLISSRLFNFDYEGNQSLSLRLAPWAEFFNNPLEWIVSFGQSYDIFITKFGHDQFPYPHNLFLELIFFNGIFGFALSLFLLIQFVKLFFDVVSSQFESYSVLYYSLAVIFIGSMFSGNNLDNYVVISMTAVLVAFKRKRWVSKFEEKHSTVSL